MDGSHGEEGTENDGADEEDDTGAFVPLDDQSNAQYTVLEDLQGTAADVDLDEDVEDEEEDAYANANAAPVHLPSPGRDDATAVCTSHSAPVYSVACAPDAHAFASGAGDDSACVHLLHSEEQMPAAATRVASACLSSDRQQHVHSDSVAAVSFRSDSSQLAAASLDGTVSIWQRSLHADGSCAYSLAHQLEGPSGGLEWVCWHPYGSVVLAGSEDFTAWMWSATDGAYMALFSGHSAAVTDGGFTRDGKGVLTTSADSTVRLWQPKTGECLSSLTAQEGGAVTCMHTHPNGSSAIIGGEDGTARVLGISGDVPSKSAKLNLASTLEGASAPVESVGFSSTLAIAAVASQDGYTRLYDGNTGALRTTCTQLHRCRGSDTELSSASGSIVAAVTCIVWNPTAPAMLATAGSDGSLLLWDARSGKKASTLLGHSQAILEMCFTPSGNAIFTASDDAQCRLFDLRTALR